MIKKTHLVVAHLYALLVLEVLLGHALQVVALGLDALAVALRLLQLGHELLELALQAGDLLQELLLVRLPALLVLLVRGHHLPGALALAHQILLFLALRLELLALGTRLLCLALSVRVDLLQLPGRVYSQYS